METRALAALDTLLQAMPPVRAMALRPLAFDGRHLRLGAPLAANVNDKGCAFGGSLAGAMTLAAWGLITLRLREAGVAAEVYVADSALQYRVPLYADLLAEAELAPEADWEAFLARLRERGRARIAAVARVLDAGGVAVADMQARFVAVSGAGTTAAGQALHDG